MLQTIFNLTERTPSMVSGTRCQQLCEESAAAFPIHTYMAVYASALWSIYLAGSLGILPNRMYLSL